MATPRVHGLLAAVVLVGAVAAVVTILGGCASAELDSPSKCHTYVVVPPQHDDEKASDLIAGTWIKAVKTKLRKCDKIVPFGAGKEAFLLLGISHEEALTGAEFEDDQVSRLTDKTHASHLVVLPYHVKDGVLTINPRIIRLRPWRRMRDLAISAPVTAKLPKSTPLKPTSGARIALTALRIIPNAFEIGIANASFNNGLAESGGPYKQYGETDHGQAPPILSSISFTNLDHPYSMRLWDFGWDWFGSLEFVDVDATYLYSHPPPAGTPPAGGGTPAPDITFQYSLQLFMMVPSINGGFFVHTPIGTTTLYLGIGPGIYTYHDSLGNGSTGVTSVIRFELAHTVFMTEKWFLQFAISELTPQNHIVDNEDFRSAENAYYILGIGYFFPEARSLTRQLF